MFDSKSRYAKLATLTTTDSAGREVAYVSRRMLPQGSDLSLLVELKIEEGDRLDRIAHRVLGRSEMFWLICDGTDAMNPFDLVDEEGARLRVPLPGEAR